MREEGVALNDGLPRAWNMHANSAYRRMYDTRPLTPQMIAGVVELLSLDEFDAAELYQQAAREAGYLIDGPDTNGQTKEQITKIPAGPMHRKDMRVHGGKQTGRSSTVGNHPPEQANRNELAG